MLGLKLNHVSKRGHWGQQASTCTIVDLSSVRFSDNHLRGISQWTPQPSLTKIRLKIIYLKFNWNLPGTNESHPWGDQNVGVAHLRAYFLYILRGTCIFAVLKSEGFGPFFLWDVCASTLRGVQLVLGVYLRFSGSFHNLCLEYFSRAH